jgi:hypothetical protein
MSHEHRNRGDCFAHAAHSSGSDANAPPRSSSLNNGRDDQGNTSGGGEARKSNGEWITQDDLPDCGGECPICSGKATLTDLLKPLPEGAPHTRQGSQADPGAGYDEQDYRHEVDPDRPYTRSRS